MNSISRNKYIDKSATPLKAYFTLASVRERAQTTYAPALVRTDTHTYTRARARARARGCTDRHLAAREKEEVKREAGGREASVLIEEWFAPSIKNLVCFWPTDIEEKLFAWGI